MKGIQGNLSTMSVSDLLQFLAAGRKTGMLRFDRGKTVKQIYFEKGIIVGSNTNDPKEYLGQLLIHYGKLDESKLKAALQIQRESGGRLGEILVSTGVLSQADVLEVLRIRTLDIIYDLFLWEEAHFELYDNESPPDYFIRIEVEPTKVIMDGVYRIDEWKRFRTLIPSDRALLELGAGWTSSLNANKEMRQILYFVEKRMSVAEICYNMHAAPFHVYGQLYDLVKDGIARVTGEAPESFRPAQESMDVTETLPETLATARSQLRDGEVEAALSTIQNILEKEPTNSEARSLLSVAEDQLVKQMYTAPLWPNAVPRVLISEDGLTEQQLGPQEAFLLSRMNGEWDVSSILSICPFREIDSLRMIKTLLDRGIINF
ncbi:MAG TPA: DUF4388 domain-containing protein [Pyrinomonadaceae bacterium]|jgi:hypothetical protein|nr:DUF4388 domain-containing protein [Pyrinomonadaceae bacterium]